MQLVQLGLEAFFNGKWFQGRWPHDLLINKTKEISIEWQELFPVVLACALWYPHFSSKRLQFWCDNQSVVAIINSGHCKAPRVMDLVGFYVLISNEAQFPGQGSSRPLVNNEVLSRFHVQRFRELAPGADHTPAPSHLPS